MKRKWDLILRAVLNSWTQQKQQLYKTSNVQPTELFFFFVINPFSTIAPYMERPGN